MKMALKLLLAALALAGALASLQAQAQAALVAEKSYIRFVSIKNSTIAEVHRFAELSGALADFDDVLKGKIRISLASVDTLVPIRDERMRELFFEVADYPMAVVTADVDIAAVYALRAGQSAVMRLPLKLELHGHAAVLNADVEVARLGDELHVSTRDPVIVNAERFGLTEGVEKLRAIVGLERIATAIPVTAKLVFTLPDDGKQ